MLFPAAFFTLKISLAGSLVAADIDIYDTRILLCVFLALEGKSHEMFDVTNGSVP